MEVRVTAFQQKKVDVKPPAKKSAPPIQPGTTEVTVLLRGECFRVEQCGRGTSFGDESVTNQRDQVQSVAKHVLEPLRRFKGIKSVKVTVLTYCKDESRKQLFRDVFKPITDDVRFTEIMETQWDPLCFYLSEEVVSPTHSDIYFVIRSDLIWKKPLDYEMLNREGGLSASIACAHRGAQDEQDVNDTIHWLPWKTIPFFIAATNRHLRHDLHHLYGEIVSGKRSKNQMMHTGGHQMPKQLPQGMTVRLFDKHYISNDINPYWEVSAYRKRKRT
jgi:hypothetical protein